MQVQTEATGSQDERGLATGTDSGGRCGGRPLSVEEDETCVGRGGGLGRRLSSYRVEVVDNPLIRSDDSEKTSVDYRTIRLGLISVARAWWRWVPV